MDDAVGASKEKTDFGFSDIPKDEKARKVEAVFDEASKHYDVMNDCMAFGLHRRWKHLAVKYCHLKTNERILDLACGSGDITRRLYHSKPKLLVASDYNANMLEKARSTMIDHGCVQDVHYLQADAHAMPFSSKSFDLITIGFGLRNMTDKAEVLNEMLRLLDWGGRLVVLEFSRPENPLLRTCFDAYNLSIVPAMGGWLANDRKSYQYLAESIVRHPNAKALKNLFDTAGFQNTTYLNLLGGGVTLHRGYKV